MKAGSSVIIKYRLKKRLGKIKEFLAGCNNKNDVKKKVEESYAEAIDSKMGGVSSNVNLFKI